MSRPPKAYLAGPDVFFPKALDIVRRKKEICARHGIEGLSPFDNELDFAALAPRERGLAIGEANYRLMDKCDLMIANLTPYHGPSADIGTAAELTYMYGAGKRIFAYSNDTRDFATRVADLYGNTETDDGTRYTPDGMLIENFGLIENCMIDTALKKGGGRFCTAAVSPGQYYISLTAYRQVVAAAAETFDITPRPHRSQTSQPL